jgi:hypothetical protein
MNQAEEEMVMFNIGREISKRYSLEEAIRSGVSKHLHEAFRREDERLGNLDRWTQRRVYDENMAKVSLVLEADDSAEHCYQNLIREIDVEAENGIYLVGTEFQNDMLRRLANDPGISGELHLEIPSVAQSLFVDELEHSTDNMDLVWVTIQARYDRAQLDASVSELVMRFMLDSAEATGDITNALRALMYSSHEDTVRRICDLPSLLDERESRDLVIMVFELEKRSGSYDERIRTIGKRAGTV